MEAVLATEQGKIPSTPSLMADVPGTSPLNINEPSEPGSPVRGQAQRQLEHLGARLPAVVGSEEPTDIIPSDDISAMSVGQDAVDPQISRPEIHIPHEVLEEAAEPPVAHGSTPVLAPVTPNSPLPFNPARLSQRLEQRFNLSATAMDSGIGTSQPGTAQEDLSPSTPEDEDEGPPADSRRDSVRARLLNTRNNLLSRVHQMFPDSRITTSDPATRCSTVDEGKPDKPSSTHTPDSAERVSRRSFFEAVSNKLSHLARSSPSRSPSNNRNSNEDRAVKGKQKPLTPPSNLENVTNKLAVRSGKSRADQKPITDPGDMDTSSIPVDQSRDEKRPSVFKQVASRLSLRCNVEPVDTHVHTGVLEEDPESPDIYAAALESVYRGRRKSSGVLSSIRQSITRTSFRSRENQDPNITELTTPSVRHRPSWVDTLWPSRVTTLEETAPQTDTVVVVQKDSANEQERPYRKRDGILLAVAGLNVIAGEICAKSTRRFKKGIRSHYYEVQSEETSHQRSDAVLEKECRAFDQRSETEAERAPIEPPVVVDSTQSTLRGSMRAILDRLPSVRRKAKKAVQQEQNVVPL